MTTPDRGVESMLQYLDKWDEAGAIGHIVLTVMPGGNDEVGVVHYFTFGPEDGTPEQVKLFALMDRVLDAIATRLRKQ